MNGEELLDEVDKRILKSHNELAKRVHTTAPETAAMINEQNTNFLLMQKDIKLILEKLKIIEASIECKAEKEDVDKLEEAVEKLKKFKWQAISILAVIMWLLDRFGDRFF